MPQLLVTRVYTCANAKTMYENSQLDIQLQFFGTISYLKASLDRSIEVGIFSSSFALRLRSSNKTCCAHQRTGGCSETISSMDSLFCDVRTIVKTTQIESSESVSAFRIPFPPWLGPYLDARSLGHGSISTLNRASICGNLFSRFSA